MRAISPYSTACKIPPTRTTVTVEAPFPATVETEKPKSLATTLWRLSAYSIGLIPSAMAADVAARAFMHSGSTVLISAPITVNVGPQTGAPETAQPAESSRATSWTALRPIVLTAAGTVAIEVLKEAGKDLWKAIKKKLWPESSSAGDGLPPGSLKMKVQVEQLEEESDALEGPSSDADAERFASETLVELHQNIQSKRGPYAKRQRVHVSATFTPRPGGPTMTVSTDVNSDSV
jgi:hypothetical protein